MKNSEEKFESPCIRNCCLDQNDICLGCYRSMTEIMAWTELSKREQEVILICAKQREKEMNKGNDQK
jgi:predicted Fe-S protein YdhL (DUF1289 family)